MSNNITKKVRARLSKWLKLQPPAKPFVCVEEEADALARAGVLFPPAQIGDKVLCPNGEEATIVKISVYDWDDANYVFVCENGFEFHDNEIGNTVFVAFSG